MPGRPLVVVAVDAERDAVLRGAPDARVVVGGIGPVAAAVATTKALASDLPDAVYSLGIAGAFDASAQVLIGTHAEAAELGVESAGSVVVLDSLSTTCEAAADLLDAARTALSQGKVGRLLTVWTVTGTAESAARLRAAHPDAVGEAMEGFGVASAAAAAGVRFLEVRTVSNVIGPRDREAWDIAGALERLAVVAAALLT